MYEFIFVYDHPYNNTFWDVMSKWDKITLFKNIVIG
jgi:hypothetical protein